MENSIIEKPEFGCWGHAFNRTFYYTDKTEKINVYDFPGGVAFIQKLLIDKGLSKDEPLDTSSRCEHVELRKVEDKDKKESYFVFGRKMGFTEKTKLPESQTKCEENTTIVTTKEKETSPICTANCAVVFDEGLGDINLPDGNFHILWASDKAVPEKEVFEKNAERCFLMLDADVLRNKGAMISKNISWERSAENLLWQLTYNNDLKYLLQAPHILVTFAEDGAVYIKTKEKILNEARITLTHEDIEGSLREKKQCKNDYAFLVMATAAAVQLHDVMTQGKDFFVRPILKAGEKQINSGYQFEKLKKYDCYIDIPQTSTVENDGVKIPVDNGIPVGVNQFVIANEKYKENMIELAENYVKTGKINEVDFPVLSIGKLKTIDRGEIEAFSNISNVIRTYYYMTDADKPLSIAVFGKPGSGKSFGVKQIASSVLPKDKIEDITFNVTQFSDDTDHLGECFQQVRDIYLKGKLPLVFFDEFDAGGRKWLKNFLMPMQDGKFNDQSGEHPLGKCILVFAGGTASTFDEFRSSIETEEAKTQKLPDFASRIKGSIDIAGPDPRNGEDENYILRRALMLRSMCERDSRIDTELEEFIDDTIIRAMLLVPKFLNGARSMENILAMSNITTGKWLPANLPLGEQLSLHVNSRTFTDLLLFDVIINEPFGSLAEKIHDNYLVEMKAMGITRPNVKPWKDLSYHFKISNLDLARSYFDKMALIGCVIEKKPNNKPEIRQFPIEQRNILAKAEHDRWMKEKITDGWVYNPVRDDKKKHHDCMIEWEKLTFKQKSWDIKTVNEIIPLLNSIGYGVYKKV